MLIKKKYSLKKEIFIFYFDILMLIKRGGTVNDQILSLQELYDM